MEAFDLENEIRSFLAAAPELSKEQTNPWVVFAGAAFKGRFAEFEEAYAFASRQFAPGTFLIRRLNAEKPFAPFIFASA